MNIILIGLRGSGKTTIGKDLADQLWRDFVDLDDLTLAQFDEKSVSEVFESQGEEAWREAELKGLREVIERDEVVIALGGGTAMIPEAQTLLNDQRSERGDKIVYLRATSATLEQRLADNVGDRPSLTGVGTVAEIEQILDERSAVYEKLADQVVDVDHIPPHDACTFIVRLAM